MELKIVYIYIYIKNIKKRKLIKYYLYIESIVRNLYIYN